MATREQDVLAATDPDQDELRARIEAAIRQREAAPQQFLARPDVLPTGEESRALAERVPGAPTRPEAFGRGVVQGATFEFGDEISAGVRSLVALAPGGVTPGEKFEESVEEIRARNAAAREAFPITSAVGTVVGAGGVTLAGGAAVGAVRGAATGARLSLGRIAALGAAEGAVVGTGAAEGGLAERARGGATGAAVGAVAAPLVTGVGRGLGAVGTRALDVTGLRPSREAAGVVGRTASRFIDTIEERAERNLAQVIPEGRTLTEAAERLTETTRPLTVMETSRDVARRARAAVTAGGRAGEEVPEFLAKRVAGQEERVINDALRITGSGNRASAFETRAQIVARRKEIASPLFEEAFTDPATGSLRTVPRELLADVLDDPDYIKAYNRGRRTAAREGIELPQLTDDLAEIPLQGVQFMKEGVDDIVGGLRRRGRANEARVLGNQLRDVMEEVKTEVPVYRQALEVFAGEKRLEEALEQGQKLFRTLPDEAEAIFAELTESEQEMFVRGGLSEAFNRIEGTNASFNITARRPLSTQTNDIRRMRLLFPSDEAFAEFQQGVADEAQIAITNRLIANQSATADKVVEFAQFSGVDVNSLLTGNVVGLGARAMAAALGSRGRGFTAELGEAMIPMLTATGPEAADVLRRLTILRQGVGAQLSLSEAVAAGVVAGGAAGVARPERPAR